MAEGLYNEHMTTLQVAIYIIVQKIDELAIKTKTKSIEDTYQESHLKSTCLSMARTIQNYKAKKRTFHSELLETISGCVNLLWEPYIIISYCEW